MVRFRDCPRIHGIFENEMFALPRQQSYAPTPYGFTPNPSLSATINLDEVQSPGVFWLRQSVMTSIGSQTLYNDGRAGSL